MDNSPTILAQRILLPPRPLAPFLRLAHVTRVLPEQASQRARLRVIDDFELVFQFAGSSWIWSEPAGGSVDLPAGACAFIPPGFTHGWAGEPGAHIAIHFDLHAKPELEAFKNLHYSQAVVERRPLAEMPRFELAQEANDSGVFVPLVTALRAPDVWRGRLEPLVQLWQCRAHQTLAARLLFAETLAWALRTLVDDAAGAGTGTRAATEGRILALLGQLESGTLEKRPSVEELAARAGMRLTAFRAAFVQATGRGPRAYLEERSIERAARVLVESDRTILQIAGGEGYEDPYHFSRVFKRVMGMSPRAYRRARQA